MEDAIREIVREVLCTETKSRLTVTPIARGGSQRSFYRVRAGRGRCLIFMQYDNTRQENAYYASLAEFLREVGVAVPHIYRHDPARRLIVMEDLGDKDLWHYRQAKWKTRKEYYCQTLREVSKLHAVRREDRRLAGRPLMEAFGPALYRWEHDYFRESFVGAVCHIALRPSEQETLVKELELLMAELETVEPCLIHRDFQSQNVMIRSGKPVLIDFQGMRFGNPFYDVGALLYDPYAHLKQSEREELLAYYYRLAAPVLELNGFHRPSRMLKKAAVQRLMQALGAYGYLGMKAGHPQFLAHIPAGLENLLAALEDEPNLAALRELALRCRQALAR